MFFHKFDFKINYIKVSSPHLYGKTKRIALQEKEEIRRFWGEILLFTPFTMICRE